MDAKIKRALERDLTIDIITKGRRSGKPRRTEIWFHNVDGKLYITGDPGPRDWYANMLAHPQFTFRLKESTKADLPARARPITDDAERRRVLTRMAELDGGNDHLEEWIEGSPLVEVELLAK